MPNPSLIAKDILAVASLRYANGTPRYSQRYIAALFGVSRPYVSQVLRRNNKPRRRLYAAYPMVIGVKA